MGGHRRLKTTGLISMSQDRYVVSSSCEDVDDPIPPTENEVSSSCQDNLPNLVSVAHSNNVSGKRRWDKKNYCLFCSNGYINIARHLKIKHANEMEVAQILFFSKNSKTRKVKFSKLVKFGNYKHNCQVLRTGIGQIVAKKRPCNKQPSGSFLPCDRCLGFFSAKLLYKHYKTCKADQSGLPTKGVKARGAMLLPTPAHTSQEFKNKVLQRMHQDAIFDVIRQDKLIVDFGNCMTKKVGNKNHQCRYIANQTRELGRLLIELRKISSIKHLEDCLTLAKYDLVIKAVKTLAGFDEVTHIFSTPTLAIKLGLSIKKCCGILIGQNITNEDTASKKAVKDFLKLMEINWNTDVSSKALNTLDTKKFNKPSHLPTAKDLIVFNKYIKTQLIDLMNRLQKEPSKELYSKLCKVILCQIITFNRRRVAEVERMTLEAFNTCTTNSQEMQDEIYLSLSETEKMLVKSLTRIEIRGKRGRKVPVLLTNEMKSCIDMLVDMREEFSGALSSNIYLFPNNGVDGYYRAANIIHMLAVESGVKVPENLTSTRLRKHIATVSQILNLKENELDILANFMGHDVRVHREFYRLPENTLQLAKVSKVLSALDKGNSDILKGKTLDDIDVSDIISGDEEESEDEQESEETVEQPDNLNHPSKNKPANDSPLGPHVQVTKKKLKKQRSVNGRRPWSEQEKNFLLKFFSGLIQTWQVPGKRECEECIMKSADILSKRSWTDVKFAVYNHIKKL